MNRTDPNLVIDGTNETPNLAVMQMRTPTQAAMVPAPKLGALASVRLHWPEYFMEAGLLGAFMVSACVFGALYEFPQSPVHQAIMSGMLRRLLMGMSMGLTAIAIIYSPWGKQSGAHINPSVTFTFFRLGKIKAWDALFYITAQFLGAVLGVLLVARFLGRQLSDPAV
ncbi:MAG: aquaporin, partial [Terriglobales bacterium]